MKDVIIPHNPIRTLCNLVGDDGRAIVEIRTILGRASDMDNYMDTVTVDGKVKYRSCYVIKKYYLELPHPMTKDEVQKYIEDITEMKTPIPPNSKEEHEFIIKLYEYLSKNKGLIW